MKTSSSPLGGRLLKIIAYSCFVVSVFAACSSDVASTNPSASTAKFVPATATELSTGISADTIAANFGQSQSAENVAAMRTEVNSFFAKQNNSTYAAKPMNAQAAAVNSQTLNFTGIPKPVYRFFNTYSGAHFFTSSEIEKNYVQSNFASFNLEGEAFYAMQSAEAGLVPIYRFYNKVNGAHFFTASADEKDSVIANLSSILNYEGEAWYARATAAPGWIPIYRMYNTSLGTHFYTSSDAERTNIQATLPQFNDEGIAYFVLASNLAISGTAATGAPFPSGSKVEIIDKTGAVVGDTVILNPEGSYNIVVPASAQPPLIIKASADGTTTMYSVSPTLVAGTVNVTPITNLIAARLSPTGNPANLAVEVQAGTATVSEADTTAKTQQIMTALSPITVAVGDTTNPISGAFTANGTGHDKLLDSLKIKITPTLTGTVQGSNIDVTVVVKQADGAAPIVIPTFSATAAAIPNMSVASIPANTVVVDGTATKIRDLVARLQTCYGLPLNERVTPGGSLSIDVIAPACRTLFVGDNPSSYKSNGGFVSANGSFSGIFSAGGTGVLFDLGVYEDTRPNGDITLSFRTRSPQGLNASYTNPVARLEGTQLKFIGNQWNYDANIRANTFIRTYPNNPSYDHKAIGYNIFVADKVIAGNSIFNKVIVTSPLGTAYTMKPSVGSSNLVIEKSPGVLSTTTITRLNGVPLSTQSLTQIASRESNQIWEDANYWTDTQISNLRQRGTWRYDFYFAANATAIPDTTEYRSTFERAPTVAELRSIVFAKFTDAFTSSKASQSAGSSGGNILFTVPTNGYDVQWDVPLGAMAPVATTIFGRAPNLNGINNTVDPSTGNRFDDAASFGIESRSATILCSSASAADLHCDAQGKYAVGSRVNFFNLRARTINYMDLFTEMGTY